MTPRRLSLPHLLLVASAACGARSAPLDSAAAGACVPAAAGQALAFQGGATPQYVTIPDTPLVHLGSGMTVEAWIDVQATDASCIVCKPYGSATDDSFALWFQDGLLHWGLNATSVVGAATASWPAGTGAWHHVAATVDASTQMGQLFIDGALAGAWTGSPGSPVYDGSPVLIAADEDQGTFAFGFVGIMDEVRIYSAARTAKQIAGDMRGSCAADGDAALVAYYPFNEGSGTVVHDATLHHLDGTLGAAGASPSWVASTVPF